jgi:hypothetical protein
MDTSDTSTLPEEEKDGLRELFNLVKDGTITSDHMIKIIEDGVRLGKCDPELLTFVTRYLFLLKKIEKSPNKAINIKEIVEAGFYESEEEIYKFLEENYEEFKDHIAFVPKVQESCKYTEPTQLEINQNIEYTLAPSKLGEPVKICIVCTHRKNNTVCVPCGHSILCTVCAKALVLETLYEVKCPVCRHHVENMQKIF